jgi:4'-phosphopantetheinyl transferase
MLTLRTINFAGPETEAAPPLTSGEAHVWVIALDAEKPECLDTLSPAECSRASRFISACARNRFIQRRRALRAVLSGYTRQCASALAFKENAYGKPELEPHSDISFSTSHSKSLALVALTRHSLIGVDIERVRADRADVCMAERFFTRNEALSLARLNDADRVTAFFNAWTRKEAIVKAIGRGLSIALDAFEVTLRPGEAPTLLEWNVPDFERRTWQLLHFEPRVGYVGAVAITPG